MRYLPEDVVITPGHAALHRQEQRLPGQRDAYIRDVVKKWRFDTIAVHGLYTVEDAIEDYQGSIIEPIFMSTSQAYRDSDEMAAALAYLIPTWCYSRIANPSTYYYEWTLALLEGYGFDGETSCCSTSSGMAAIMTAVQPFLVHTHKHAHEPRNFVATAQCYGGTFQQFNVRLAEERGIECRWVEDADQPRRVGARRSTRTRASSTASCPCNPGPRLLRHRAGRRPGARAQRAADLRHRRWRRRRSCGPSATAPTSSSTRPPRRSPRAASASAAR